MITRKPKASFRVSKQNLSKAAFFESVEEARSEVFSYIENYYNRIRRHSGLNYQSPLEFEKQLENKRRSKESLVC
jgi:transposase InsO family protein